MILLISTEDPFIFHRISLALPIKKSQPRIRVTGMKTLMITHNYTHRLLIPNCWGHHMALVCCYRYLLHYLHEDKR